MCTKLPKEEIEVRRRYFVALFLAAILTSLTAVSSASAGQAHWSYRKWFNGTDVNYAPFLQDSGAFCAFTNGRPWMLLPGPTVEGPGVHDNVFKAPGTFDVGIDGTNESTLDILNRALNQTSDEVIRFLPAIQWPDGSWHFPTETNPAGQLQWMQATSYATPGAGSADASWLFWRNNRWEAPAFDGFPGGSDVAPGFGSDWEFDSMFMDGGAGTYHIGGYLEWWPYPNSDNGNGTFPGEYAFYVGDYDIPTNGCMGGRGSGITPPSGTATSGLTARTLPKLIGKLRGEKVAGKSFKLHVVLTRHTKARAGRYLKVVTIASTGFKHPKRSPIKSGKVTCRAKIGKHLGPKNHHHLLRPLHLKKQALLHRSRGANSCVWLLPRNSGGKRVAYSVTLRVKGIKGSATFADVHKVLLRR